MKSATLMKSSWEKSLYIIVVKRGEVCTVVKSLPVTWKIIYLLRICYSLHALECGRSSSKIFNLQVVWCLDFLLRNFCPTEITLLSVGQNFITGTTVKWLWLELVTDMFDLKCIVFYAVVST